MILFIFEGEKYEPQLYKHVKSLFFPQREDQVVCSFCSSIYTFYKRMKSYDFAEVVDVLKVELIKNDPNSKIFNYKSSDFESVYLFFDYDFYFGDLEEKNKQVNELLDYFNEETGNGKLFISYPMIESIQYTKELPDSSFHTYTVVRNESQGNKFKASAKKFCFYKDYSYLKDRKNWDLLIQQHVQKANLLTKGTLDWPTDKDEVDQSPIFQAQLNKHVLNNDDVAILNAFPLFLYYYFPKEKFEDTITNQRTTT